MELGRVVGKVVCTIKDPKLHGIKLLLVEPLNHQLQAVAEPFVAADSVGAGSGEIVYYETAREAPFAFPTVQPPIDAAIIGIVDRVQT
jgi:ethanolamine utilization protein EutN